MESNNFQQALPVQVPAHTDYRQSYQLSELFTLTKSLAEAKPVSQQGIATKGDRQKGQKGWWNLLTPRQVLPSSTNVGKPSLAKTWRHP